MKMDAMTRQRAHVAFVDLDSHLSVTGRCRSLVGEFRGGQSVAAVMVSSVCDSEMPHSTESALQA